MSSTEEPSVFLAIWPDGRTLAEVTSLVVAARERVSDQWRWQPPQRWHVTVVFLGATPPDRLTRISEVTGQEASATAAGTVRVVGAGLFGPVLWLGIDADTWLRDLHQRLRRRLGVRDARGAYRPHLTVARWRGPRPIDDVPEGLRSFEAPPWTPPEVSVVVSHGGPAPLYEVVSQHPFSPPRSSM